MDRYFEEGRRTARFLGEDVTKYHRTLTTYLDGLLTGGFQLLRVVEPQPPARMLGQPGMRDELRRPMMLLVSARKRTAWPHGKPGRRDGPDEKLLEDHEYTERKDCSMKTGLVLEGGALRTIFSSGVCDAFLNEKLPMPDYTIGVSAGIAYGVSYLSRQKRRNLQLLMHYANDRRYMGWGNFFDPRNRSYFGLKFAYDTIPNELVPFDYDTFEAYPGQVEAVVTNLQTGRAEYREVPRRDASFLLLQATCAMPVLFQPIRLDDGAPYLDGGCSDAIPWKRALAVGCDRVVVVLTRERSYRKEPGADAPVPAGVPQIPRSFWKDCGPGRSAITNAGRELFALEQEGRVLVIAPANTRGFSRTERDRQKILALWQDGFFAGRRAAEAVRDFWTRETPSAGTPE